MARKPRHDGVNYILRRTLKNSIGFSQLTEKEVTKLVEDFYYHLKVAAKKDKSVEEGLFNIGYEYWYDTSRIEEAEAYIKRYAFLRLAGLSQKKCIKHIDCLEHSKIVEDVKRIFSILLAETS